MLTHDREQAALYDSDALIFRQIAVNLLLDLHDTAKRLVADAGAIQTPTLMIGAGKDWVVSLQAQQEFFDRLSSTNKRFEIFPNAYHAIFHETNRRDVIGLVREFVQDCFAEPATAPSLLDADKSGYTAHEHEDLKEQRQRKIRSGSRRIESRPSIESRYRDRLALWFRFRFFARLRLQE